LILAGSFARRTNDYALASQSAVAELNPISERNKKAQTKAWAFLFGSPQQREL
jgi:hypothetical protein